MAERVDEAERHADAGDADADADAGGAGGGGGDELPARVEGDVHRRAHALGFAQRPGTCGSSRRVGVPA